MIKHQYKIFLVDDNKDFIDSVLVKLNNFQIYYSTYLHQANDLLNSEIDLVLLDLVFDENNPNELQGMHFIKNIKSKYPDLPVIIISNYSETSITIKAIKSGADDFINKKNLIWNEWKNRLEYYAQRYKRIKHLDEINKELEIHYDDSEIICNSYQIIYLKKGLKDLAENSDDINIFITGETETGKNLAVRYFKKHSRRKNRTFKEFSLFELSDKLIESELFGHTKGAFTGTDKSKIGLFEETDGGILFLDEIGDYDIRIQKKIMCFIDEKVIIPVGSSQIKKLNLQLILATNKNLEKLISESKFREDLYQRINRIKIPPFRERKEDIKVLTDYYFNHLKRKEKTNLKKIDTEVYDILEKYYWPGNVRELQSVIFDACTRA